MKTVLTQRDSIGIENEDAALFGRDFQEDSLLCWVSQPGSMPPATTSSSSAESLVDQNLLAMQALFPAAKP